MGFLHKKTTYTFGPVVLACFLLCSLFVHTFEFNHVHHSASVAHEHTENAGVGDMQLLGDYFHGTEKKSFLLVLLAVLLILLFTEPSPYATSAQTYHVHWFILLRRRFLCSLELCYSYLKACFRRGILNPKYF
jgi:hypothetical protein